MREIDQQGCLLGGEHQQMFIVVMTDLHRMPYAAGFLSNPLRHPNAGGDSNPLVRHGEAA
jgi:hypothetical protein